MRRDSWLIILIVTLILGCERAPVADVPDTVASDQATFRVVEVAGGLEHPWAMAFLPDGDVLITERPGRLRIVREGVLDPTPIEGVPEVYASGQGGLLDVVLDPDFASNRLIYLSYAAEGEDGAGTRVARARLGDGGLEDLEVIFEGFMAGGGRHFGSRLGFDPDGYLFITLGERGQDEHAQELGDLAGKVVRLHPDGSVPEGNPFAGRDDAAPEVFSYGHRNPQGLAVHPETGRIWVVEHGPRGGDEVNLVAAGVNYGWPVITHGRAYSGLPMGEGSAKEGMAQPLHYWVPSISPSGLAFYGGDAFPQWQGDLFTGGLSGEVLARLELDGERVVEEERLLEGVLGRIRDVRVGPDGYLYLLTDESDGGLHRLEPA
ncbi:MAG TPA: PQQ-dependent sugar dehydrogenase [Geminicoccaceae bacterium]|jgi:glucose/arabinose dehydrogenase|nr:PQQ-dependent sugar dehydrogenase [Geminicoccaceae bacterium]